LSYVIGFLLTIGVSAFIIWPLFRQKQLHRESASANERLQELHSKRDTAYAMIKELEFDYQSGILAEDDYRELESKYKGKAVNILKNLDTLAKGADPDDEIEKRVRELRQQQTSFCPECGSKHRTGDKFCSHCGMKLVNRA